jgi:hypothetical protein
MPQLDPDRDKTDRQYHSYGSWKRRPSGNCARVERDNFRHAGVANHQVMATDADTEEHERRYRGRGYPKSQSEPTKQQQNCAH